MVNRATSPIIRANFLWSVVSLAISTTRRSTSSENVLLRTLRIRAGTDREMIAQKYVLVLSILTSLFAFRVFAQLIQFVYPVSFLPPYAVWHSGTLSYEWLVAVQGLILMLCLRIVWRVKKGMLIPSRRKGMILFNLGMIYLLSMGIRLIVGLTIATDHYWFGATIPAVFHVVLASFVICYGQFHLRTSQISFSKDRDNPL